MARIKNIFRQVPIRKPKRNVFDLSFDNLLTVNFGDLCPVMCKEVIPGDTWQVQSTTMLRFAPMLAPIMHRCNVYIHYFFVPNRILWSDFEDFITGGKDGTADPVLPYIDTTGFDIEDDDHLACVSPGSLWDYIGLPTLNNAETAGLDYIRAIEKVSFLPFAAYRKIYEDYYKDQNLDDEFDVKEYVDQTVGVNFTQLYNDFSLKRRAWEKDYFTSALPWPQRGGDVHLPLTGDASVSGDVVLDRDASQYPQLIPGNYNLSTNPDNRALYVGGIGGSQFPAAGGRISADNYSEPSTDASDMRDLVLDPNGTLKVEGTADMSDVTSATINELRRSLRLQEWLEKNARSGARYIEQILSHFGVRSSDGRLDRAEYLGGGKIPVQISEVLQTSETTPDSPLADMAGHGLAVGNSARFRKFFEEHGYVFGILSVVPRSSYGNGIPKHFTKFDKFDFAWPEFANLGEQEIKCCELNLQSTAAANNKVFGYTPRYAEYKFSLNEFHGDFRGNLAFWHLGRMFPNGGEIKLNSDFVHVNPESDKDNLNRIFAVQNSADMHLWLETYNRITVKRTLPKFGVPTL